MIKKDLKIYIAGHKGMVGSACWKILKLNGYNNLVGKESNELDLRNKKSVYDFLKKENPDIIINAAAKVGGILANQTYPYEFIMENMQIQNNLISSSHELDIKRFIFLGSSCIYPRASKIPIKEEYLLRGELEETNQWYAIAKISGVKTIQALREQYNMDYVSLMPTNLYGPNDNFELNSSHVLPALINKFHSAKLNCSNEVTLWGTGKPLREFMHVDDLANAVLFLIENKSSHHLYNVGTGNDITIKDLAIIIKDITGFVGKINWDESKPDGTYRKLMSSKRLNKLGWKSKVDLVEGIKQTYEWYLNSQDD